MNALRTSLRLLLVLAAAPCAMADEFLPRAGFSILASDNINRQENSYGSDVVLTASAGFRYVHESARWNMDLSALGSYAEFLDNTYDARTLGSGMLLADLVIVPEILRWEVQDNFGQIAQDSFGAIEPDDRQNTNYFSTGPDLAIPVGRSRIDLRGRYSDVRYDSTEHLNNNRTSAQAAYVYPWTDIRTLSVNLYQQNTRFDRDDLFRDYELRSAFLALRSTPRRNVYQFEVGVTEIDDGLVRSNGTLFGFTYGREISSSSSLQVYGRRGFADSADTFRFQQGDSSEPIIIDQDVQVRADPYRETRFDMALVSVRAHSAYSIVPYWVDEDFVNSDTFDRSRTGIRADISRAFGGAWMFDAYASYEDYSYVDSTFEHRDGLVGLGVTRSLSPALQVDAHYELFNRSGGLDEYTENRIMLVLSYAPQSRVSVERNDPTRVLDRARGTNSQPTFAPPVGAPTGGNR